MKQVKLIFISLIMWSISPMLQSCDKNDDDNDRQQDTTLNESNNPNNGGSDSNGDGNGGNDNGGDNGNGGFKSCPDSNHPHMIDLGLPSGTLWACCNVGASKPEDYGNYYAWGEVQSKSVYANYTYAYWHDSDGNGLVGSDECTNLGSNIAGTSYDAATVNWGAPWRMPSGTQIVELRDNTTAIWTTENSVYGQKFTGSTGGSIFLPATGYRWESVLNDAGSYGYYWSSTISGGRPTRAYYLFFRSGYVSGNYFLRYSGCSVRPVRPN